VSTTFLSKQMCESTAFEILLLQTILVLLGHQVSATKYPFFNTQAVTAHWRKIRGTLQVVFHREWSVFLTVRAFAAKIRTCCLNLSFRSKYTPSHLNRSVDS
jgi:hypothetical protein